MRHVRYAASSDTTAKVVLLFRAACRVTQFSLGLPNRYSLPDGQAEEAQKRRSYSLKREASVDSILTVHRAKPAESLSVTYTRYNGEMDALVYVDFPGNALVGGMTSILVSW